MGGGDLEKVVKRRIEERRRALEEAIRFSRCVAEKLGRITAVVYGSYARGDFNEWSDVDVLIVTDKPLPKNPLRRLDAIYECLRETPDVEPLVVTLDELKQMIRKRNPVIDDVSRHGVILVDELGLSNVLRPSRGSTPL